MIRTTVRLEEDLFKEARKMAIDEGVPFARIFDEALRTYLKKGKGIKAVKDPGVEFLVKISKFQMKGGPRDLAKNHDKYTWE